MGNSEDVLNRLIRDDDDDDDDGNDCCVTLTHSHEIKAVVTVFLTAWRGA